MKVQRFYSVALVLVVLMAISAPGGIRGQAVSSPGILLPYDGSEMTGLNLEGLLFSPSEIVPGILENPAGPAFLQSLSLTTGFAVDYTAAKFGPQIGLDTTIDQRSHRTGLTYSSLLLPFRLMKKPWAAAAAFNGRYSPIYASNDYTLEYPIGEYSWEQSGNISSASLALSARLFPRTGIGISWTKWFGEWKEIVARSFESPVDDSRLTGAYDYTGQFLSLGFITALDRLTFGLAAYTPTDLMEGEQINQAAWRTDTTELHQTYHGALKAYIVYNLKPTLTFGIAYRYQEYISSDHQLGYFTFDHKYGPSTKLAVGVGYTPKFRHVRLPIYAAYTGHWMPVSEDYPPGEDEASRFSGNLALGMSVLSGRLGIHTAIHATRYNLHGTSYSPWPPWG
ncbi:hypothetical protein ACFL5M_05170 [Candidatus Neomarinimicrobiota bacterium]